MFLKHKYALSERPIEQSIRDVLTDEDGRELVILRIAYPSVPTGKKSKKKQDPTFRFNELYEHAAHAFEMFARNELLAKAKQNPKEFKPCGAVLRWSLTEETEKTFTVRIEGSVYDGTDQHPITPDVRVWDRESGLLMPKAKGTF